MEIVDPIRNPADIAKMKKLLLTNEYGKRDHLLFVLGINSALRVSDLINLKWEQVFDQQGKLADHIKVREKKTGKINIVAISPNVIKATQLLLDHVGKPDPQSYVFESRIGESKPITRQHAGRILRNAARMLHIPDRVGPHSLRKTFAYHLYKSGVGIEIIQKLLNHSSPQITLAYIGITKQLLDETRLRVCAELNL